jgi:hypothetical protein
VELYNSPQDIKGFLRKGMAGELEVKLNRYRYDFDIVAGGYMERMMV